MRPRFEAAAIILLVAGCAGRCNRRPSVDAGHEEASLDASLDAADAADSAEAEPPRTGDLEHPYQPMAEGDTWSYRTTQAPKLITTSSERILSVERVSDRVVARVKETQVGGGGNSERSLILTTQGISPNIGVMRYAGGTITTVSTTGIFLPIDLGAAPRTWSYSQVLSSMHVSADVEAVGIEAVSVPAGEYQAVHLKSTVRHGKHIQHEDTWFAPGVGLVKATQATPAGYRSERVLLRFERGADASGAPTPSPK